MKIGFTGTRHGCTVPQQLALEKCLRELTVTEAHHGDCVGADYQFHDLMTRLHPYVEVTAHPATLGLHLRAFTSAVHREPAKPPLKRNRDIVDATDMLIGCPASMSEQLRSGTWATIRYARSKGKPVTLILLDGKILED